MLGCVRHILHDVLTAQTDLEVGGDRAPADVDEGGHVVEGVEGPDAALQVEVSVQLDGAWLSDLRVELVWPVVPRAQGDAVVGHVLEETRLWDTETNTGRMRSGDRTSLWCRGRSKKKKYRG